MIRCKIKNIRFRIILSIYVLLSLGSFYVLGSMICGGWAETTNQETGSVADLVTLSLSILTFAIMLARYILIFRLGIIKGQGTYDSDALKPERIFILVFCVCAVVLMLNHGQSLEDRPAPSSDNPQPEIWLMGPIFWVTLYEASVGSWGKLSKSLQFELRFKKDKKSSRKNIENGNHRNH